MNMESLHIDETKLIDLKIFTLHITIVEPLSYEKTKVFNVHIKE